MSTRGMPFASRPLAEDDRMNRRRIEREGIGGRRRCRLLVVVSAGAISVALGLSSPAAHAAPAAEPISLVYEAPRSCPGSRELLLEITRRTRKARAAREGERARRLHVTILPGAGMLIGYLRVEESGALSGAREVRGETCGEVVEALGLVAALAVDPDAEVGSPAPPAAPDVASSAPADAPVLSNTVDDLPDAGGATRDGTSDGSGSSTASTPLSAPRTAPRDAVSAPAGASSWSRLGFGFGVQGEGAALADIVFGARLFGDVQLDLPGRRIFAPSVRLVVARTSAAAPPEARALARLRWTQAALEGCPLVFDLARAFDFRPCAGVSAGVVEAESSGVPNARSRTRPWMSVELHGRVAWSPVRALSLEIEAGSVAPLVRETFVLQPSLLVYEAPAIAFVGRGGVSVRFR